MKSCIVIACACLLLMSFGSYNYDKIKGGYKKCNIYQYEYKFGKLDLESKEKIHAFKYDSKGNIIEEISYTGYLIQWRETYLYNKQGNIIEDCRYDEPGLIEYLQYKKTYKFDLHNNIIENVYYKTTGELEYKYTYQYDTNDDLIKEIWYDKYYDKTFSITYEDIYNEMGVKIYGYKVENSGIYKHKYNYNDIGMKIEEIIYKSNNSNDILYYYKYDEKGRKIEHYNCPLDSTLNTGYSTKSLYRYDNFGNVIEVITSINGVDSITDSESIKYNNKGIKTEKTFTNAEGRVITITKYDNFGNIIEEINYDESGEPYERKEYIYSK